MAVGRVKTWIAGEVLTASDLNAEFNNILNNAADLANPLTKALDMNGFELILDADADSSITADTDDRIDFRVGGVDRLQLIDGTKKLALTGVAVDEAKGSDIASATTTDIGAATGSYVDVTGTTTITGLGTVQAGTEREIQFDGALTLTHNGTSLILPGDANISIRAGDIAKFRSLGSGNWILTKLTRASGLNLLAGKHTIWVPGAAMRPTVSNGCAALTDIETTAGRPDLQVLDFDATADEHAQFQISFPKSWNEGTITYQAFWTVTAAVTTGVAWALQGVAVSDNDTIDVAYGTAVVVTDDALNASNDLMVTAESSAVTIAGTPAEGDTCFFRVFRDVSDANDDMTQDARLIGIQLFHTLNAEDDI